MREGFEGGRLWWAGGYVGPEVEGGNLRAEVWGAGGGGQEVMPGGRLREFMEERSVGPRLKVGGYAGRGLRAGI